MRRAYLFGHRFKPAAFAVKASNCIDALRPLKKPNGTISADIRLDEPDKDSTPAFESCPTSPES